MENKDIRIILVEAVIWSLFFGVFLTGFAVAFTNIFIGNIVSKIIGGEK